MLYIILALAALVLLSSLYFVFNSILQTAFKIGRFLSFLGSVIFIGILIYIAIKYDFITSF